MYFIFICITIYVLEQQSLKLDAKIRSTSTKFSFCFMYFLCPKNFFKQNIKLVQMERLQANPMVHQVYTVFHQIYVAWFKGRVLG